jgi:predicted RNA binding protein YcfA (HicA-like mRNA interferase family)
LGRLNPLPFREVKRRLEAAGFLEAGQRGSHVKFVRRAGEIVDTTIVPRKSEVAVGTLRSILRQAHIDPDEWDRLGK